MLMLRVQKGDLLALDFFTRAEYQVEVEKKFQKLYAEEVKVLTKEHRNEAEFYLSAYPKKFYNEEELIRKFLAANKISARFKAAKFNQQLRYSYHSRGLPELTTRRYVNCDEFLRLLHRMNNHEILKTDLFRNIFIERVVSEGVDTYDDTTYTDSGYGDDDEVSQISQPYIIIDEYSLVSSHIGVSDWGLDPGYFLLSVEKRIGSVKRYTGQAEIVPGTTRLRRG